MQKKETSTKSYKVLRNIVLDDVYDILKITAARHLESP